MSEAPALWAAAVTRWRHMNSAQVRLLPDGPAPEPAVEWMLYQALAGVWPPDLAADDRTALDALKERFIPFVEKSLREAKLRTDWSRENETYETAVRDYARAFFAPENLAFRADFLATLSPFLRAGLVNSLAQTIVKLTAPGVPDIYQGCEGLDFSLVDPDNRREPDFETLERQLADTRRPSADTEADWRSGRLKQHVVATLLRLRQEAPSLFRRGNYLPLAAEGKRAGHLLAFARTDGDDALVVIVPRLVLAAFGRGTDEGQAEEEAAAISQEQKLERKLERRQVRWAETDIVLPPLLAGRRYRDIWSGATLDPETRLPVAQAFGINPFAILRAE